MLNTCCIRENADNKLYGNLGLLKAVKDRPPRPADRRRRLPGPEGPRRSSARRRPTSTSSSAPTTCTAAADLARAVTPARADHRDPRRDRRRRRRGVPLRPPPKRDEAGHSAWVTIQIGCDNSCAFCIVPAVRGPEISRPFAELVAEVEALAAGRRHRGHAARPERQLLRPRSHAGCKAGGRHRTVRPLFADLLRAVGGDRGHPTGPLHESPSQGPPARHDRRRWPRRPRCASTSTCRSRPAATARSPPCTAATPPSATSSGSPRRAPPSPTSPSPPTSSSASRARPTTTSSARSRSSPSRAYDSAYTFIFSPRPGTEAAAMHRSLRRPRTSCAERFDRLRGRGRAVRPRSPHGDGWAASRKCVVEGPSKRDQAVTTGRTRQNKLVHFAVDTTIRPGTYATVRVTGAAPHHLHGELVEVLEPARHRTRLAVVAV